MLERLYVSIATVILLTVSHQAISATFDFAAIANSGEYGADTITFTEGGLSVTASGFNANDSSRIYNAYLDSSWYHTGPGAPGGNGGLGVCKKLNAMDQCRPSSDDNISSYESLRLIFNQEVTIDQMVFRNGNHGEDFLGQFTVAVGTDPETTYDLTHIFETPLTGTDFIFTNINSSASPGHYKRRHGYNRHRKNWFRHGEEDGNDDEDEYGYGYGYGYGHGHGHGHGHNFNAKNDYLYEFYISSMDVTAIPVPAAVWLFASGLLGLAGFARRRD